MDGRSSTASRSARPGPTRVRLLCGTLGVLAATAALASPASAALTVTAATSVSEGNAVHVTVTRPAGGTPSGALDVTVQATGGTATAGNDFDGAAHSIHFNANQLSQSLWVSTVEDTVDEDAETFRIGIDSGHADDPAAREVTITDDDAAPTLSIGANVSAREGTGSSPTPFGFEIKLSNASSKPITLPYTVWDSGAVEPEDFTNGKSQLVIAPGSTAATLTVPVVADNVDENDEKFSVELSDPSNASLTGRTVAWGTILNDDVPTVSVTDAHVKEGDSGATAMIFTVALSNPSSARDIYVNYEAAAASATSDDYTPETGRITFSRGETSDTILVWVQGDTTWEPDESFAVTLSGPEGATMGRASATGTIENDDAISAGARGTTAAPPATAPAPSGAAARPARKPTVASSTATTRMSLTAPLFVRPARVRTTVSCPASAGTCSGTVAIFTVPSRRSKIRSLRRELKIGTGRFTVEGGKRIIVAVRPSPRIRALLRQARTIRVRAYLVANDERGRVLTKQMLGTLRWR
jgi:Calx-beta domain-containing protein